MNRTRLRLPRRLQPPQPLSAAEQLQQQTIGAEIERLRGEFSPPDLAAELGCRDEAIAQLTTFLMPRGQRFHVRRVLTHIAAYLRIDALRLRELLERGDLDERERHAAYRDQHPSDRGWREPGEQHAPKVVVLRRRHNPSRFGANVSRESVTADESLEV